jgi:hypothetical protein
MPVLDCNFSDDAKVHGGVLSMYMTENTPAGMHSVILLTFSATDQVNINYFLLGAYVNRPASC